MRITTAVSAAAGIIVAAGVAASEVPMEWAMEGITYAVVLPVAVNGEDSDACGIDSASIEAAVLDSMNGEILSAAPQSAAQPVTVNSPALYLVPSVTSLKRGNIDCVSWVGLRAQSAHRMTLPSTGLRKDIQVLFWERGLLMATAESDHGDAVTESIETLARQFATTHEAQQSGAELRIIPDGAGSNTDAPRQGGSQEATPGVETGDDE